MQLTVRTTNDTARKEVLESIARIAKAAALGAGAGAGASSIAWRASRRRCSTRRN